MFASLIAMKGELKFQYSYLENMLRLGLPLYLNGEKTYDKTFVIDCDDTNFHTYLDKPVDYNLDLQHCFAQNHEFAFLLFHFFRIPQVKASINGANPFKDRNEKNNDVFVHVRLGDAEHVNPGYLYYETALKSIDFTNGYISSDSPDHPIVKDLIANYGLQLFNNDEVTTIQFGSTCKHILLSYGTFSWVIGALGFDSQVYFPPKNYLSWHGPIFDMPDWKIITV